MGAWSGGPGRLWLPFSTTIVPRVVTEIAACGPGRRRSFHCTGAEAWIEPLLPVHVATTMFGPGESETIDRKVEASDWTWASLALPFTWSATPEHCALPITGSLHA